MIGSYLGDNIPFDAFQQPTPSLCLLQITENQWVNYARRFAKLSNGKKPETNWRQVPTSFCTIYTLVSLQFLLWVVNVLLSEGSWLSSYYCIPIHAILGMKLDIWFRNTL